MAGASLAFRLATRANVLLLEREAQLAYHSTGRSAATYEPNFGSPVIRALTRASAAFFRSPPEGFAPVLSPRGCLLFGADEQRAALEREQQLAAASRQTLRVLSPAQILALVPVLKPAAVGWGIHEPLAMDMDVEALLQGFLRSARRHGLRVLTGQEVLSVRRQGARWHVRTSQLEIRAEVLVNAAGAWADRIAGLAGIAPLGLIPCRRTAFTFDAPAGMDVRSWPMVMDAEERFYFKPDAGRMLGSLAEEVPSEPCDAQADDLDVAIAVDRIESAWTQPITRVVRAWAGLRTFSSDRNPVSGFEPSAPGFYWHAALGGYGIQTAAALSALAAANISGSQWPNMPEADVVTSAQLAPDRFR